MSLKLKNDRLIRALLRQPVDCTPVWIMRQAGRYLPEYRETRAKAGSFMTLCTTPELACEVTLQPLQRFDLDAAILFSDILTIPDAMGMGLSVIEQQGPVFEKTIRSAADLKSIGVPDPENDLAYVMDAVRLIRKELDGKVPLIGFSGSPWTLATYMVEGGSSKNHAVVKAMLYEQPELMHELLDLLADSVITYLNAQIEAGAQAVMVFDTWGGLLTSPAYEQFSLGYMDKIVAGLHRQYNGETIPLTLFTKGGGQWVEKVADTGCNAIGLDWTVELDDIRARVGDRVALQGNLDPAVLYSSPAVIESEVSRLLNSFGKGEGHVFNLGHGIHPQIDPEHVAVLVDAVHQQSIKFHID